jgi:hypothetical protein
MIGTEATEMLLARRRFALAAVSALAIAASVTVPRATFAQPTRPHVEVLVLYAKKDAGGGHMDPAVPKLPQLSQGPFAAYNTFELVDKRTFGFGTPKAGEPWAGKPSATYQLATGKSLDIALLEQRSDGRCEMGAVLGKDAADKLRWSAPVNESFFVAGQTYKDGILVIGITLRP